MKPCFVAAVWCFAAVALFAQQKGAPAKPPMVREGATVKVSEHVWVIPDDHVPMVPNVGRRFW